MWYEQNEDKIICFDVNEFAPFEDRKIGEISQCNDEYYRFKAEPEVLLTCGMLKRLSIELARLNVGG